MMQYIFNLLIASFATIIGEFSFQYQVKFVSCYRASNDAITSIHNWFTNIEQNADLLNHQIDMKKCESFDLNILQGPLNSCYNKSCVIIKSKRKDGKGLPIGKVKIHHMKNTTSNDVSCPSQAFSMSLQIKKISGIFVNGFLNGKGTILYKDLTKMKVIFQNGVVHGRVLICDKYEHLQAFGFYESGLPQGPFWFNYESNYIQIYFEKGHIVPNNCVLLDADEKWGVIGTLKNQAYLIGAQKFNVSIGLHQGMKIVLKPKERLSTVKGDIRLPLKISSTSQSQRIMIRPSNILYFNRIPKTASFSIAFLLESIGFNLGYNIDFGERPNEVIFEDRSGITKDMTKLLQIQEDHVYCRHFSFYNLQEWGYSWIPDWFTIVRDPIQRVISYTG